MKRVFATLAVTAAFVMVGQTPGAFAAPSATPTTTTAPAPAPAPASPTAKAAPASPTAKAAPPAKAAPTAGRFCKKDLEGKTAKASDGTALTCTPGSDGRDRWTSK